MNVVIVAVKQRSIRRAAEDAALLLGRAHGGLCISLLNGLGHMETLKKAFTYVRPHCVSLLRFMQHTHIHTHI